MSSIKKNYIFQISYQILIIILPIFTAPYVSRVLGVEGVGTYSYTFSVANYFVLFAMLGINNHGSRRIAMVRDNKEKLNQTFSSILTIHIISSIIMIILYLGYSLFIVKENSLFALISTIYILAALFDVNWFFFGMEKFKITVTRNIIIKILTVLLIFLCVKDKNDLVIYILIMAIGTFISQSMIWGLINKYVQIVKPSWSEITTHFKPMLIMFIPTLSVSLYRIMDKVLLGALTDHSQVGLFDNAEKIINIPLALITGLGTVMLPRMSNLVTNSDFARAERYFSNSMKFAIIVSLGWFFGVSAIAPKFAPVFFGIEFEKTGAIMQGLAITIPFIAFANVIRTQYLIPNNLDSIFVKSVLIGAVISVITNIILIPHYQALGSTVATVLAEISVCAYQCWAVRRELSIKKHIKSSVYFVFLGFLMFIIVSVISMNLPDSALYMILETMAGVLIYSLGTLIYLYIFKDELLYTFAKRKVGSINR
ncbi:oligosaccharide flippase family protein [Paenibacillus sp. JDR-2]|uniref:oligosaccharide flippase family protein n=1 Tax=Paenibacillus sp. (strain JDR-2) TaxID=324057 RepID=UPI000166B120|nr:oligosaccharide flippase family protein [Paenibacillus sp. JDR-2]